MNKNVRQTASLLVGETQPREIRGNPLETSLRATELSCRSRIPVNTYATPRNVVKVPPLRSLKNHRSYVLR